MHVEDRTTASEPVSPLPELAPPGYYPFRVGSLECLAVCDGFIPSQLALLAAEVRVEEVSAYLQQRGRSVARIRTQLSCLLVRDPRSGRTMLVDSGMGELPGPDGSPMATLGHLPDNLRAAGIGPEAVDTVLVSHLHPDHIGGLFDSQDRPVYPDATYYVPEEEARFWSQDAPDLSGQLAPPPFRNGQIYAAKRFLRLAADRVRVFAAGETVIDEVTAVGLPGHTPAQVGFLFQSDDDALLYTADAIGHALISVERPGWRFALDIDPATAISTRHRLIKDLQAQGRRFFSPHFPWPNLGRIGTVAGQPCWMPEPYDWSV